MSLFNRVFESGTRTFGYTGYDNTNQRIIVAFRGTNGADLGNWITNLNANMEAYPTFAGAKVHAGF